MKLNAIIIDDEKDACENINHLIATYFQSYFNQIFIVHSTKEAEAVIDNHPIDLFFIDIEMPSESGIDFAARRSDKIKNFIFITAYDQYAINAFRLHAFDYILKPIDENLFSSSVSRLLNQSSITPINDILHFAQQVQSKTKIDTLTLRDKNSIEIVAIKDIIYIEAERAYSKIVYELKDKKIKTYLASHNLSY